MNKRLGVSFMPARRRVLLIAGAVAVLALVEMLIIRRTHTVTKHDVPRWALSQPADGTLRDKAAHAQGSFREETQGNLHTVMFSVALASPPSGQQYDGWLFDPAHNEYRYAGVFYPVHPGEDSLVYTTEEGISRFHVAIVSQEALTAPARPAKIVATGAFAESTAELAPGTEPTAIGAASPMRSATAAASPAESAKVR